ncbi:MAG TPA: LPS biosynthesis protein [Ruminiclostridium sp.]|nr:LPS biosynthesis protein [Ruminiclostridium sp.]
MKIDGNDLSKLELELHRQGKNQEGDKVKMEFLRQVRESGEDHCPCPESCRHHGNCYECVILHRGHGDHLPFCMWDMVNERMRKLSLLTEDSLMSGKK